MTALAPPPNKADDASITIIPGRVFVRPTLRQRLLRWFGARRVGCAIAGAGAVCATSVFALWFRVGSFYARGDLAPFVRTGLKSEFGQGWTHQMTGAGGPTYEVVRGIELVFLDLAHLVGGGDALGQRLLFAAIFAFAATGVAAFTARFVTHASLVFVGGVIGAFAPLTMVNLPNFLLPVCIGLLAWGAAFTIDAARNGVLRVRTVALITLSASYLALNPALIAIALFWFFVLPLTAAALTSTGRAGIARGYRFLGRTALWALPLSLWWVVPYVFAMRSAASTGTINANTSVQAWSWTHAHGSMDRVLMLLAKWSWPDPNFASNASSLATNGWLWLAAALPITLLCAPIVARRSQRRAALWCVLGVLVLAFVAKGLNQPMQRLNEWFYRLPGTWLLREPMAKVGAVMVPLVIVGWALTADGLFARRRTRWVRVALVLVIGAPLAFALPMVAGTVVGKSERVTIPRAWEQTARVVNDGALQGKALILPLDDFYQMPTTWGYYGTDTVIDQLLRRPSITRNPQSYIGEPGAFGNLAVAAQAGIIGGDPNGVPGVLRALNVSYIVVRRDIDHGSRVRSVDVPDADALTAGIASVPDIRRISQTSVADVYEFSEVSQHVEALSGTITARNTHDAAVASLVASAGAGTALTATDPRIPVSQGEARFVDVNATRTVSLLAPGTWQYQRRAARDALLQVKPTSNGLVLHEPVTLKIGDTTLATRADDRVDGTGPAVAADVDGTLLDLTRGPTFSRIAPGAAVTALKLDPGRRVGAWSDVRDCNNYSALDLQEAGLSVSHVATPAGPATALRAERHSACISAPVVGARMNEVLRISLDTRVARGAPPRACLWLSKLSQCAPLEWSTGVDGGWYRMRALYRLPVDGSVRLYLYADQPPKGTRYSEVWYRNVAVERLLPGPSRTVKPSPLPAGQVSLQSATAPLTMTHAEPDPIVGRPGGVRDCAQVDGRSLKEAGIEAEPLSDNVTGVRLRARSHSACVALPVTGLRPAVTYELDVDQRVVRGAPARVCVWQDATDGCARFSPVGKQTGSNGRLRYRGEIDPTASAVSVYLYADANKEPSTIEYRRVQFQRVTDESLVLWPSTSRATVAPPQITSQRHGTSYHVQVRGATAPFVLALSEAFARGWHLHGLPHGARSQHMMIDGYRNGWVVDARGNLDLTLEYAPSRFGQWARYASIVTVVIMLGMVPFAPSMVRRRRRVGARWRRARRKGPRRVAVSDAWSKPAS